MAARASARLSRARLRGYVRAVVAADIAVIVMAASGGYLARFAETPPVGVQVPYGVVTLALMVAWLLSLRWMRCYEPRVLGYGPEEYRQVLQATFRLAGTLAIAGYLLDLGISRGFLGMAFVLGTAGLLTSRWTLRRQLHRARARQQGWSHRVLAVGAESHVLELLRQLRGESWAGYRVIGACLPDGADLPDRLGDVPVLGTFSAIVEAATAAHADTIAVTASAELTAQRLRRLGWQLEGSGIDLVVAPALTDVAGPRIRTRPVGGLPLIHVGSSDRAGRARFAKELADRLIAASALLMGAPALLLIAVAVKLDSRGPVIFRQRRVGRDGCEFDLYKFRTMVPGADRMVGSLRALNDGDGPLFKMRRDPRVTRVGRLLRRYSLDELPQLVNVLAGTMSLVGPRPPLPSEVALYDGDVARRLLVKPGITGLWQVSGRSDLSWEDGVRLDLYYVENWSFTADLVILWKTVGAVVRARGAY